MKESNFRPGRPPTLDLLTRWRGLLRVFPSTDPASTEGQSRQRYQRVVLSALTSGAAQAISAAAALILVPVTLGFLGSERYGLWMTIVSVAAVVGFADFGLGNGLINLISQSHGQNDQNGARTYVAVTAALLSTIALLLGLVLLAIYGLVPWPLLFNVNSDLATAEAGPTAAVLLSMTLIGIPLAVVTRTRSGYQEGFVNGLWLIVGTLVSVGAVLSVISVGGGLPLLAGAAAAGPLVAVVLNGFGLFRARRWLIPRSAAVSLRATRRAVGVGAHFFLLQAAITVAYNSDNVIIARFFGTGAVTEYSVTSRLFNIAPLALGLLYQPLWPAYGEAIARKDIAWVRKTLRRSLLLGAVITVPPSLILLAFAHPILRLWVGAQVTPSVGLLAGFASWAILTVAGGAFAMLLNGARRMTFQVVAASVMTLAALGGKLILPTFLGLSGVIWSSVIAQFAIVLVPTAVYIRLILPQLEVRQQGGRVGSEVNHRPSE